MNNSSLFIIKSIFFIFITFVYSNYAYSADFSEKTADKYLFTDFLINKEFIEKYSAQNYTKKVIIKDDYAIKKLQEYKGLEYKTKDYNYAKDIFTPIKIKPVQNYCSKKLKEGENLKFLLVEDIKNKQEVLVSKNTIIHARVENISPNEPKGIPADLIIGNFVLENQELYGQICKTGASRFYWVRPLANFTSSVIPFSNYAINLIRGGHAKIRKNQIYEIYLINHEE